MSTTETPWYKRRAVVRAAITLLLTAAASGGVVSAELAGLLEPHIVDALMGAIGG